MISIAFWKTRQQLDRPARSVMKSLRTFGSRTVHALESDQDRQLSASATDSRYSVPLEIQDGPANYHWNIEGIQ